jgi:hypothetical protein
LINLPLISRDNLPTSCGHATILVEFNGPVVSGAFLAPTASVYRLLETENFPVRGLNGKYDTFLDSLKFTQWLPTTLERSYGAAARSESTSTANTILSSTQATTPQQTGSPAQVGNIEEPLPSAAARMEEGGHHTPSFLQAHSPNYNPVKSSTRSDTETQ